MHMKTKASIAKLKINFFSFEILLIVIYNYFIQLTHIFSNI